MFVYDDSTHGPILAWNSLEPVKVDTALFISPVRNCVAISGQTIEAISADASTVTPAFSSLPTGAENHPRRIVIAGGSGITSIRCDLILAPLHATYSERRFQIVRDIQTTGTEAAWHMVESDMYQVHLRDAENLRVLHADPCCPSMHYENTYIRTASSDPFPVSVEWVDIGADRLHEFQYFVAAAIIGLATSCLLEAARGLIVKDEPPAKRPSDA